MNHQSDDQSNSEHNKKNKADNHKTYSMKDFESATELWTDGLICAFEFVRDHTKLVSSKFQLGQTEADTFCTRLSRNRLLKPSSHNQRNSVFNSEQDRLVNLSSHNHLKERYDGNYWMPIGWARISELVKTVQVDGGWNSQLFEFFDDEDDITVADLAAPYWKGPAGPVWWCHVAAGHSNIDSWLNNPLWLHPAISLALRDERRLISEKMKHLLYEVPVRVAGGLLFELLGQSVGDPLADEDDIPVVLRSWQAQNFLITVLHVKGNASRLNVLGITEVQELLTAGGYNVPRSVHEVIAQLACRLSRWDDRLFRKTIFGAADEIEIKFMNRRNLEDLNLFSIILNQEIRRLSQQVIRVKWSLHAREEIVYELTKHLRGSVARSLLESIKKSTRKMIEEQEAVRGRLFTIQDVMQNTVRAWLQDRSLHVNHNLTVFGGCGLVLSIITGLFGINVDGIPGEENTPYAFGLFSTILFFIGVILIVVGLLYFGLKKPITEEQVEVRTLDLQELVKMFEHEAEHHAPLRRSLSQNNLAPATGDVIQDNAEYVIIQ